MLPLNSITQIVRPYIDSSVVAFYLKTISLIFEVSGIKMLPNIVSCLTFRQPFVVLFLPESVLL